MSNLTFTSLKIILVLILLSFPLVGCSVAPKVEKRYFWPPGSSTPRIEYVDFYHAQSDVKKKSTNPFMEAVLGKDLPYVVHSRPNNVAVSSINQRLFVADQGLHTVVVWDFAVGEIRPLVENDGRTKQFSLPTGLTLASDGSLYVVDSIAKAIEIFDVNGVIRQKIEDVPWKRPFAAAVDLERQRIYVADPGVHQIFVLNLQGGLLETWGERGKGSGKFNFPLDVDLDPVGNLYVLDSMNARVQVFSPDGTFLRQFGERGNARGSFSVPKGLAVLPQDVVAVTDSSANRFVLFNFQGEHLMTIGGEYSVEGDRVAPGGFLFPSGIDGGADGSIWVVDSFNRMVHHYQLLTEEYLSQHPIKPEQVVLPEGFRWRVQ